MIEVTAQCDCGCCFATMHFKSLEAVEQAFAKVGLCNGAVITDDEGVIHEGIDTFYGFSTDPKYFDEPPLSRLAKLTGLM